jgi:hypothetical protein
VTEERARGRTEVRPARRRRSFGEIVRGEIRELTPLVIYFFIALNVVGFTRTLILKEYGISVSTFVNASIGSLIVAKVVLVVGFLPFMEPFPRVPVIYNALWKTFLYVLGAIAFQILEKAIPLLLRHERLAPTWEQLATPHFWVIQIWLTILFLVFCTFRELFSVLGPARTKEIFLGIRASRGA